MNRIQEPTQLPAPLPWTGERMVPHHADLATELFHWQRYLFFRPWYEDCKVVDAACGEGYGTSYAAVFAASAKGYDICRQTVEHARRRYRNAAFEVSDVTLARFGEADVVVSFETIEHLENPRAFLRTLSECSGRVIISTPNRKTHSPGNGRNDRHFNEFHTMEWMPFEFADLITGSFPGRTVRFLSQESRWPGLIREGLDDEAMYCIAVIGDGELPKWPRLGIAVPTVNNADSVRDMVLGTTRFYPGEIEFAIVANGTDRHHLASLRRLAKELPHILHIVELPQNLGYAAGANRGLELLTGKGMIGYYGVCNDDVLPALDCVSELVCSFDHLNAFGCRPGVIGPVSNEVHGPQRVDIGEYRNYAEMLYAAEMYHLEHSCSASAANQVRGLLMLMAPDCLKAIGGFDPCFGLGNFEDDDHNLRTRLAGFSLWIADCAFLHHEGSATFRELGIDYRASIARNGEVLLDKWGCASVHDYECLTQAPAGTSLYVALDSKRSEAANAAA